MNNETGLKSPNLPGGTGGPAPASHARTTSIDLSKPKDMLLVRRAVLNGWHTSQPVQDQIVSQLVPAINTYLARGKAGHLRSMTRVVKLAQLGMQMDATHRITNGCPRSWFPFLRKRYPEKRQPRRLTAPKREANLQRLLDRLGLRSGHTETSQNKQKMTMPPWGHRNFAANNPLTSTPATSPERI